MRTGNYVKSKLKKEHIIKKKGGANMRNEEVQAKQPTIHEREINLTLINDKLNYIINLFNKVAEKEGIDLEE